MKTMNLKWMAVPVMVLLASQLYAADPVVLKSEKDRINYAIGVNMINTVKQQGGEVNLDIMIKGMMDGLTGENLLMSEDELRRILAARQSELAEKQKQAANQPDKARSTSADAGQTKEPAVPQKKDRPEQKDDQAQSNATFAKKEGPAQKTGQDGQGGGIAPNKFRASGKSVVELDRARSETKRRALEMRTKIIEQHRGEI
jgi:hypothetical protein